MPEISVAEWNRFHEYAGDFSEQLDVDTELAKPGVEQVIMPAKHEDAEAEHTSAEPEDGDAEAKHAPPSKDETDAVAEKSKATSRKHAVKPGTRLLVAAAGEWHR